MTHINAYLQEREELKTKLNQAQGEFDRADEALRAHPDFDKPLLGEEDPKEDEKEAVEVPVQVKKSKK